MGRNTLAYNYNNEKHRLIYKQLYKLFYISENPDKRYEYRKGYYQKRYKNLTSEEINNRLFYMSIYNEIARYESLNNRYGEYHIVIENLKKLKKELRNGN